MRHLRLATFDWVFVRLFCGQGRFQSSCAISSWGVRWVTQVLLASPAPLRFWRSSRIARFWGTPRVDTASWKCRKDRQLRNLVKQGLSQDLVVFGGHLAVTWRSQVGGASTAMTVLTAFTSCCALTTLTLQTFRPPKGSPPWKLLMGRTRGEKNWHTAQKWLQDNTQDGQKNKLRWTSTKVPCYKGGLWQLLSDLASWALTSRAKPQRDSESRAFGIARLKCTPIFRIAGLHCRIFAGACLAVFLWS